jgi:hypothetical protein
MSETATILIHRLMVKPEWVPVAIDRLRAHGIEAQATAHDVISGRTCIDWNGPEVDVDFLRPDILPPKK